MTYTPFACMMCILLELVAKYIFITRMRVYHHDLQIVHIINTQCCISSNRSVLYTATPWWYTKALPPLMIYQTLLRFGLDKKFARFFQPSKFLAPLAGLEPATLRLTAECSTDWAKKACIRRRHILPGRDQPSTFCAVGLNDCVRDENRWIPYAMVAEIGWMFLAHSQLHSSIRFSICFR